MITFALCTPIWVAFNTASQLTTTQECPDPGTGFPILVVSDIGQGTDVPPETAALAASVGITIIPYEPDDTDPSPGVSSDGEDLASSILCITGLSSARGGPGRLVISAESTGVLVTRVAAAELERSGTLSALAGVVSVAGTEEGFWMDAPNLGSDDASIRETRAIFLAAASDACTHGPQPPFDEACALLTETPADPGVRALAARASLAALPPWPAGLRVDRLGGALQIDTDLFGRLSLRIGNVGDGVADPADSATIVTCHYNLAAPDRAKDTSCLHSKLRYHQTNIDMGWSLVASVAAGTSAGGFFLTCGTPDQPERLTALLNIPAGAEVRAPSAGYRYSLNFADLPELDYFLYGPLRSRYSGSSSPGDGQQTIYVIGSVLFDQSIQPGDRIDADQVIGHVRATPQYMSFGTVGGTVRIVTSLFHWDEDRQFGSESPDNDLIRLLFDFPEPTACISG